MTIARGKDWQANRNKRLGLRNKGGDRMRTGSDKPAPMPNAWRIKQLAELALAFRFWPKRDRPSPGNVKAARTYPPARVVP